jgi:hypothetical protein
MVKYKNNPLSFPHLCHTCAHEREHCFKPALNKKGFISLRGEIVMDRQGNITKCKGYLKK